MPAAYVLICRNNIPGITGGYAAGRSKSYENQAFSYVGTISQTLPAGMSQAGLRHMRFIVRFRPIRKEIASSRITGRTGDEVASGTGSYTGSYWSADDSRWRIPRAIVFDQTANMSQAGLRHMRFIVRFRPITKEIASSRITGRTGDEVASGTGSYTGS